MSTAAGTRPAPVSVTCRGELPAERPLPGVLRVLVAGQHAGAIAHGSADDAVRAVLRSAWPRWLGGRVTSPVHWSGRARRAAARKAS